MRQIAIRTIIAILAFALAIVATPLLFDVLGFPIGGSLFALLRICFVIIAIFYIIAGRDITWNA